MPDETIARAEIPRPANQQNINIEQEIMAIQRKRAEVNNMLVKCPDTREAALFNMGRALQLFEILGEHVDKVMISARSMHGRIIQLEETNKQLKDFNIDLENRLHEAEQKANGRKR